MKKYIVLVGASLFLPLMASAVHIGGAVHAGAGAASSFTNLITYIGTLLTAVVPVLIGAAVVVFLFGVFRFIMNAGDEEARKSGRSMILWGIVGLFVMISVWGLVQFLVNSFGLTNTVLVAPTLPV